MSRLLWTLEHPGHVAVGLVVWVAAALVLALIAGPVPRIADREEGHSG